MGSDTAGLGGTAPGASPEPPDDSDDRLIWLPGRSPVLDAAQLGVLRGYGSERDVAPGDVLFADGDETYDLIVLLAGTADIIEGYGQPGVARDAALAAGLDPCEALVSFAAIGAAPQETFASRGWTTQQWSAARDRLAARGWIDAAGKATERGRDGRDEVEWRTDRLADAPWQALGPARAQRLADLTGPLLGAAASPPFWPRDNTPALTTDATCQLADATTVTPRHDPPAAGPLRSIEKILHTADSERANGSLV